MASDFRGYGLTERSERNGFRAEGFDFRHLFAEVSTEMGLFEIGQMPNQWGMGMVANSGNGENTADFGDARFGDIVDRILFATRPLIGLLSPKSDFARQLSVAVAADLVYRDRYASLLLKNGGGLQWGDTAVQVLGAAVYAPAEGTRAGLYVTRRVQSYASDAGDLHVWTFDAYVRHAQPVGGGLLLTAEGEAAQNATAARAMRRASARRRAPACRSREPCCGWEPPAGSWKRSWRADSRAGTPTPSTTAPARSR